MEAESPKKSKLPKFPKCNLKCHPECLISSCSIPKRHILAVLAFLAVVTSHLMRSVLSVAILKLRVLIKTDLMLEDGFCPDSNIRLGIDPAVFGSQSVYQSSEALQGLILGSFYIGYFLGLLPGKLLGDKIGVKWIIALGMLSAALFSVLTPIVDMGGDWPWLIVIRILLGLSEGIMFPSLITLLTNWVPLANRAAAATIVYAGLALGTALGFAATGLFIVELGYWEIPFYVFGGCGFVWFVLWVIFGYSDPESHPRISEEEKSLLRGSAPPANLSVPWKSILKSLPVWALLLVNFAFDWALYTMLTQLPTSINHIFKYNEEGSGLWSALPFLVMFVVAIISSLITEKVIIRRKVLSVSVVRKLIIAISAAGTGGFLIGASYAECDQALVMVYLNLSLAFLGMSFCGTKANLLDLTPNFGANLAGIINGVGALGGIATSYLTGYLTENQSIYDWRLVIWIIVGLLLATAVLFVIFGKGDVQEWDLGVSRDDVEAPVEKPKPESKFNRKNLLAPFTSCRKKSPKPKEELSNETEQPKKKSGKKCTFCPLTLLNCKKHETPEPVKELGDEEPKPDEIPSKRRKLCPLLSLSCKKHQKQETPKGDEEPKPDKKERKKKLAPPTPEPPSSDANSESNNNLSDENPQPNEEPAVQSPEPKQDPDSAPQDDLPGEKKQAKAAYDLVKAMKDAGVKL